MGTLESIFRYGFDKCSFLYCWNACSAENNVYNSVTEGSFYLLHWADYQTHSLVILGSVKDFIYIIDSDITI